MTGGLPELMMVLTIIAVLIAPLIAWMPNLENKSRSITSAWEVRTVRDAASQYIKDNWSVVYASAAVPIVITPNTLQAAGYLLGNAGGMNAWQQNHAVLVQQSGAQGLIGVVITYGGISIPPDQVIDAASYVGEFGGYVPYATDPSPCATPCVKGVGAFWSVSLAPFVGGATGPFISGNGHLAAGLFFQGGEAVAPFLYRFAQPNNNDANTMHTDIQMNTKNINNATNVTATGEVITGKIVDYNNNAYTIVPSGASTMNNLTLNGSENVAGNVAISGSESVGGNTSITGSATVGGDATVTGAVTGSVFYHSP